MNMEKNIPKDSGKDVKNSDNIENKEQEAKDPQSLARFDSVDEFKSFLKQSEENIIFSQSQIKQKQKTQETNEGLLRGGQLKETNAAIDTDIQEIKDKTLTLQDGLDKYSGATKILGLIKQKQKTQETNEGLLRGGQLKETNAAIDTDIAELNQKLEEIVIKGKKSEEAKETVKDTETMNTGEPEEKTESTETTDTGVSTEREISLDKELMEEIQEALKSKDPGKIGDITRKIYKMENGEDASLLDFRNLPEMEKYLQEKLEELNGKLKKEEQSEVVENTTKHKKSKGPKEMTPEEKAKEDEANRKAMEDKEMLYETKIDLREDISEEEKTKLKEKVKFVDKENVKEMCEAEIKNLMTLSYEKEDQDKNKAYEDKIDALSEQMGLPKEEVQKIVDTQKAKLEKIVYQNTKKKKSGKESKWKKWGKALGKIALYGIGGIALGAVTGGIGAGIGIGVGRLVETLLNGKKERQAREQAAAEVKYMLLGDMSKADIVDMSKEDKKEMDNMLDNFYDDISVRLSIEKQNQIDGESKEHTAIGKEINDLEKAYDPKDPESKKKLQELYAKRREFHKEQIKKYLTEQDGGLSPEDIEKRVKLSAQLVELEDNQKIMELGFVKRKASLAGKIFSKIDSFLSSPVFLGGAKTGDNQTREKLVTAGIFAIAGVLARSCPLVRNILMAYAGVKLGSAAADLYISKSKRFKELGQISAENLNMDNPEEIIRAKAQLADPKFKASNPIEHAKLQDKIFDIDRTKLDKLLGNKQDGEKGYVEKTNDALEESVKKRISAQKRSKILKYGFGIVGGAAGYLISDFIGDKMREKKEKMAAEKNLKSEPVEKVPGKTEPVEKVPLDTESKVNLDEELEKSRKEFEEKMAKYSTVKVKEGDTSWKLAEHQLKPRVPGWDELDQSKKDYLIDLYKDKMAANPALVGIDGGDASSLKIGDDLNFTKIFEDTDVNEALEKANALSPEDLKNIATNREFIGEVMKDIDGSTSKELFRTVNIMGGPDQCGSGFVQEIQERAVGVIGAEASPEQIQTILHNPEVFGSVIDQGIGKVGNENLVEAARLLSGTDEVGAEFVKKVTETSSLLGGEIQNRATELGTNIKSVSDAISTFSEGSLLQTTDACNTACGNLESLTNLKDASGLWGSMRRFFHSGDIAEQIAGQETILEQSFSAVETQRNVLNNMVTEHAGMMNSFEELMNRTPNTLVDSNMNSLIEQQQKLINGVLEKAKQLMPGSIINAV